MTVRVSRERYVPASPERVWAFIADQANRADAISVVSDWEDEGDGRTTWHVALPIPVIDRTFAVETEERERDEPHAVSFVGRSRVFRVRGEHRLEPDGDGTRLETTFIVDGRLPGVEGFFKRNLDGELDNLEDALDAWLRAEGEVT